MWTLLTKAGLHVFPLLFPWHGSSHSRHHWSDLLEMNGLITGSERRRNTVWRGDEWNWGLGLRKPLRQIEGINDCSTAKGPPVAHPFPWHYGCVMASSYSLWGFDMMFFSTPLRLYKVSKRPLSETTRTTCTTIDHRRDGRSHHRHTQPGCKYSLDIIEQGHWWLILLKYTLNHTVFYEEKLQCSLFISI